MPATLRYIDTDMVTVYETGADGKKHRLATLLWGDQVKVKGKSQGFCKLDFTTRVWDPNKPKRGRYVWKKHDAFIDGDVVFRDTPLLRPNGAAAKLGKKVKKNGVTYTVALEDDLLKVATSQMNGPFRAWQQALLELKQNTTGFKAKRLAYGDDHAFSFCTTKTSTCRCWVRSPSASATGMRCAT